MESAPELFIAANVRHLDKSQRSISRGKARGGKELALESGERFPKTLNDSLEVARACVPLREDRPFFL